MIKVHDITEILINQQKMSDDIYQEAIEANFSHEYMTSLNSILGNAQNLLSQ